MGTEQVDPWRWTHWPVICLFRLPLIGTLLHLATVVAIICTGFGVAAAYDKLYILHEAIIENSWRYLIVFGSPVWGMSYICCLMSSVIQLREKMHDKQAGMVIWHLSDMAYHLVRWLLFFGLLSLDSVIAASCACAIELFLLGAALVVGAIVGLVLCTYYVTRGCYKQCAKECAS
jgi:hypothetical protein